MDVTPKALPASGGTSLLEVMIATFVISLGLLGAAAVQIQSNRSDYEANQRATAVLLAGAMVARLRANNDPEALAIYSSIGAQMGRHSIEAEPTAKCSLVADGATFAYDPCFSPAAVATHDLWVWEQAVDGAHDIALDGAQDALLSPTACISSQAPNRYLVSIAWHGQQRITASDTNSGDCGKGLGIYGDDDVYRRGVVQTAYLDLE